VNQDWYNTKLSPSACLLRFLKLPEDHHKLVSLKDAAVILMAYMERMTNNYVSSHGLYEVCEMIGHSDKTNINRMRLFSVDMT